MSNLKNISSFHFKKVVKFCFLLGEFVYKNEIFLSQSKDLKILWVTLISLVNILSFLQ